MNRLTRKTNEKDFGNKERVYYMYDDENTPEKFIEKYPYHLIDYVRFTDCNEFINKLGRLEDLEEQLGCPLEIVVKIMLGKIDEIVVNYSDSGGYATPYCEYTKAFVYGIYLEYNNEWVIGTQLCTIPIKDYGKTWFLEGEIDD